MIISSAKNKRLKKLNIFEECNNKFAPLHTFIPDVLFLAQTLLLFSFGNQSNDFAQC